MLHLLDATLEAYLRGELNLGSDVDIAYEAPDSNWSARVTRPTVNLFVWDIRRNVPEASGGLDLMGRGQPGAYRRPAPPRIDFRYLITTWTSTVRDEHALLGAILVSCLRTPLIPDNYLQGALANVEPPPRIQVARWNGAESGDFWNAMGGQLKAALDVMVSASVDTALMLPAGPPVSGVDVASNVAGTGSSSRQRRDFDPVETGAGAPDARPAGQPDSGAADTNSGQRGNGRAG